MKLDREKFLAAALLLSTSAIGGCQNSSEATADTASGEGLTKAAGKPVTAAPKQLARPGTPTAEGAVPQPTAEGVPRPTAEGTGVPIPIAEGLARPPGIRMPGKR